MKNEDADIVFPLTAWHLWLALGAIVLCMVMGLVLILPAAIEDGPEILCALIFLLPLPILALRVFENLFTEIRLAPEGITLSVFGKQTLLCPIGEIRLFCKVTSFDRGKKIQQLVISPYSLGQLTALQEQKLKKGVFSRGDLPFMKRVAGWEENFARDFLLKRARRTPFCSPAKRDMIWLEYDAAFVWLLRQYYPEIPWYTAQEKTVSYGELPIKADTDWFLRDPNISNTVFILISLSLISLPLLLIPFGLQSALGLVVAVLPAFLIALICWLLRGTMDKLRISSEGIHIVRKKKEHLLPCSAIRTMIHSDAQGGLVLNHGYLAVTTQSVDQLAEKMLERMNRTERGRLRAQAICRYPDWQNYLAKQYCDYVMNWKGWQNSGIEMMGYTAQRSQILKEQYPNAQWVDAAVYE